MSDTPSAPETFPVDPLTVLRDSGEIRRRTIQGILDSYNGNYDALSEAVQNAVDALEDAALMELPGPFSLEITVNLAENWIGVLDTGIGMTFPQVCHSLAPSVSFKDSKENQAIVKKRGTKGAYRGYKGVGMTFLSYGTDDICIQSKRDGKVVKGRMQYGRSWANHERDEAALIVEDTRASPIDKVARGTYVRMQFSNKTRPSSLARLSPIPAVWETIIRTRTAAGQILLNQTSLVDLNITLIVIDNEKKEHKSKVEPVFLFPHDVKRQPPFRFLDIPSYHAAYGERTEPPPEKLRQDGLYLIWDSERIKKELTAEQLETYSEEIELYTPSLYAFIPYQGSVWGEINLGLTGVRNRAYLYPGLVVAVNRQRLADMFELEPTRFETLSRNILVIVHFNNAKPDQGRKTVQEQVLGLAKKSADRVVQYLAKHRALLRPAGDAPSADQREVERNHDDWVFNVKSHAKTSPLHIPPATIISTPLAEQDVVGLFHQLSAIGLFPGIKIFATSQIGTYDCLIRFECLADTAGLRYKSPDENPLGLSPFIIGDTGKFATRDLTLEFKNNLDGLIEDVGGGTNKSFSHIDICVCWGTVSESFVGYLLEEVTTHNLDERQYPGATHLLRRDGESHVIQVIMLKRVIELIGAGKIVIQPAPAGTKSRGTK